MSNEFIPESDLDLTPAEIRAGQRTGLLIPWRKDPTTGEQWYRRRDEIHAVPRGTPRKLRAIPPDDTQGDDDD